MVNKVVASFKTSPDILAELRAMHVNVSELVNSLLISYLERPNTIEEKVKQEIKEVETQKAILDGKLVVLKKRLQEAKDVEQKRKDDEFRASLEDRDPWRTGAE